MKERAKVAVFSGVFLLSSFITLCGSKTQGKVVGVDEHGFEDLMGTVEFCIRPTKACFKDRMRMRKLVRALNSKVVELGRRGLGSREKRSIEVIVECNADVCTDKGLGILVAGLRRYGKFCLKVEAELECYGLDIIISWGEDGVVTFKVMPHAHISATHNEESIKRYKAAGIKLNRDYTLNKKDKLKSLERLNIAMRQWIELLRRSLGLHNGDYKVILSLLSFEEFFPSLNYFEILLFKIDNFFGIELMEIEQKKVLLKALRYSPKSIEYLSLDGNAIDDKFLGKLKLLKLRELVIVDCKSATNRGLDKLAKNCPNLERLKLCVCHPITRKTKFALMKNLKSIGLPVDESEKNGNVEQLREELRCLLDSLKRQGVKKIEFPEWAERLLVTF